MTPKNSIKYRLIRPLQIRNFCSMKCPVKRTKIQTTVWEKILPNHSSDNGLLCRIYIKNPQNSTVKNQQLKNTKEEI